MSENKNEDLGLRNELNNILSKSQSSNNSSSNNNIVANQDRVSASKQTLERSINPRGASLASSIPSKKKNKKVVVQIRIDDDELEILKAHLKTKGYDTYSTGLRGIIKKYMMDNSLI